MCHVLFCRYVGYTPDITDFLNNLRDKAELSTANYIATICLPEAIKPYLKALPLLSMEEVAAIALLERYPTEDNAVFVAELIPELALFALEHVEHSAYEVLSSQQNRVFLPVCEEFY